MDFLAGGNAFGLRVFLDIATSNASSITASTSLIIFLLLDTSTADSTTSSTMLLTSLETVVVVFSQPPQLKS